LGPVACPSHVDAVPRRAVRKVGPRPDLTRSTHIGEPCGPARLLGDGSRSSCSPYRATNQSTGGGGMKNGGSNPPAPGNRCVGAPGRPIVPTRGLLVLLSPHARSPARRRSARRLGIRHVRAQQPPVRPGHRSRIAGRAPRAFRAPHGYRNPFVTLTTRRLGYSVFGWTFGVWDSDARVSADEIRRRVRRKLRPGAIVLLHDGDGYDPDGDRRRTAAALPGIIADAREAGYVFRSLAELVS